MYFYFRYVNQNEHFNNVIHLKNSCVVRVGKTCTDATDLYIDIKRKREKKIEKNITYHKLDFDQ